MKTDSPQQPLSPETIERFSRIVGPPHALRAPEDIAPYLREWRDRYHGATQLVLRPGSTAQVAEILALAHQTGTGIVPQGGNTGLVGGQIPSPAGDEIVVSLERLDRVREIDPAGNVMTVEAGVTLAKAQTAAQAHDRLFPLSLASEGSCQIGGNLSTNAGGTAVLAYGTMRDLTLGLEVVLPDGRIWHGLRGLRKDNTGYDLRDLFIGAEGTLGIITAAVLKLFPRPAVTATAFTGHGSLEQVRDFFTLARTATGSRLTAFELLPRIGLDFALRHAAHTRDPLEAPHDWYVLLELCDSQPGTDLDMLLMTLLEKAMTAGILQDAAVAASLAQASAFWNVRENMSEVQKYEGGSIKHDLSVPVANIPQFISRANKLVGGMIPGCRPVPFGHFGDGNIHYNISQPQSMDKTAFLARWEEVSDAIHGLVADMGGSISAEHGIGIMKRDMLAQLKDPVELDLMRRMKQALDPKGIMNPGKLL